MREERSEVKRGRSAIVRCGPAGCNVAGTGRGTDSVSEIGIGARDFGGLVTVPDTVRVVLVAVRGAGVVVALPKGCFVRGDLG